MDRKTLDLWDKTQEEWRDSYYALVAENDELYEEKYQLEQKLSTAEYIAKNAQTTAQREVEDIRARLYNRTTTPALWKKYRLGDCPLPLGNIIEEIPLPTEFVVTETKIVEPSKARIYVTKYYLVDDNIVTYDFIKMFPSFNGSGNFDSVIVIEYWEDYGSDGHYDYRPVGLVIASMNKWKELKEISEKTKIDSSILLDDMIERGRLSDYVLNMLKEIP